MAANSPLLCIGALVATFACACGSSSSPGTGADAAPGSAADAAPGERDAAAPDPNAPDAGAAPPPVTDDILEQADGCAGVYNPDQVLDYHLEMAPGDWQSVLADQTYSVFMPAQLTCGEQVAVTIGVRRKRSGGTNKVGLKLDFNEVVAGQSYYGLKKMSFENGVSEGSTSDEAGAGTYMSEYLAWRLMQRGAVISSRAVFARLYVNGEQVGVYVNVEQVDKRFLGSRLGDKGGWLYKKSGGVRDGFKTHETDGLEDPFDDYFCFWENGGQACAPPAPEVLLDELPTKLDIDQMLRFGAVNALMANTDSPLFKDNNYYWYDWPLGRVYIPWDLDTAMNRDFNVFTGEGIGGRTDAYLDVLFTHWEDDYDAILTELVSDQLSLAVIEEEIARAAAVAGEALDGDPYVQGSAADAAASLSDYWTQRHADVTAQVAAH